MPPAVATYRDMTDLDQSELEKPGVVVVDFTAAWCRPCKVVGAILDELAPRYAGRVRIGAVDVDREPALAQRFGVRSMPTLVLVRDGREVGRVIGSRPRAFIAGVIDRALAGDAAITSP